MIKKIIGGIFVLLFILTQIFLKDKFDFSHLWVFDLITVLEIALAVYCFVPNNIKNEIKISSKRTGVRSIIAIVVAVILVPLTIWVGVHFLGNRKYYFISILIILEILIPFLIAFEKRKPKVSELVIISVLCAIAVCGRSVFFWLPQFKPVIALVIIAGITLGGETGFLVGVVTGFVSNFFFGQGSWTPWQMLGFGMVGLLAGLIFSRKVIAVNKVSLSVFGFFATIVIYGGIVNSEFVFVWQANPTLEMIVTTYLAGLPFDIVHGVSTVVFLWFIAEPMIEKIERVKVKYGV